MRDLFGIIFVNVIIIVLALASPNPKAVLLAYGAGVIVGAAAVFVAHVVAEKLDNRR